MENSLSFYSDPGDEVKRRTTFAYDSDVDGESFDGEADARIERRFVDLTRDDDADARPKTAREQFYELPLPAAGASFDVLETYRKRAVEAGLPMRTDYLKRFLTHADDLRSRYPNEERRLIANFIRESARGTLTATPAVIGRVLAQQHPEIARTVTLAGPRDPDLIGLRAFVGEDGDVMARRFAPADGTAPVDRAAIDDAVGMTKDASGRSTVRTMPRWRDDGRIPEDDRFARLRAAEQAPAPETNARGRRIIARKPMPFERIPVPPVGASFEVLDTYRRAAQRAGVTITADDLKAYETFAVDLEASHNGLEVRDQLEYVEANTPPGVVRMLSALVEQPAALEQISMARKQYDKRAGVDRIEGSNDAQFAPDMRVEKVVEQPEAFQRNLAALDALPPLSPNASFEKVERYREAMRAVGIPFERGDFLLYRAAIAGGPGGSAELPLTGDVPMPLAIVSGKNTVPLSLTVLDELRRPPGERQLLNLGPAAFADVLLERLPGRNRQVVARASGELKPVTLAELDLGESIAERDPVRSEPEVNELPVFGVDGKLLDPTLQEPQTLEASRFTELARLERADGRLLRSPFAKRFADLPVPAADASVKAFNDYRRSANRAGVHLSAADLQTYAELASTHGSGSYPRMAVRLVADAQFAAETIADERVRRHVVAIAEAVVHQYRGQVPPGASAVKVRDYTDEFMHERMLTRLANDPGTTPKEMADALEGRPLGLARGLAEAADLKPLPAKPNTVQTEYYRMALGSVGIPLSDADVRAYEAAIASRGPAALVREVNDAASPGLKALADLYRPREQRQILDGATPAVHLGKLDALLTPRLAPAEIRANEPTQEEIDAIVDYADSLDKKLGVVTEQAPKTGEPTQEEIDAIVDYADSLERSGNGLAENAKALGKAPLETAKSPANGRPAESNPSLATKQSPLPYQRLLAKGAPLPLTANASFAVSGPVKLDTNAGTFTLQNGPARLEFKVADVTARLAPGADRTAFAALLEKGAKVELKQTPSGIAFAERAKALDNVRAVQLSVH